MEERDALLIHFAIHAGDDDVTLSDGKTTLRISKAKNGCSSCMHGGYNFMQQNPTKASNWARMARNGRKITWIMCGRQWGRIVDSAIEQQPAPPLVRSAAPKPTATMAAGATASNPPLPTTTTTTTAAHGAGGGGGGGQTATMTLATTTVSSEKGSKRLASFFDSKPDETVENKKLKLETRVFTLDIQFPQNWMTPLNKPQRVVLQPGDREWLKNTISELHKARFDFKSVSITGLERLQHPNMWGHYFLRREEVKRANNDRPEPIEGVKTGKPLDLEANEYYLFHGLSHAIVDKIIEAGFDERVSNLAGMFGCGIYFAEDSSKSMQYSHAADCQQVGAIYTGGSNQCTCMKSLTAERCMFLCRVSLGTPWIRLAATDKDKPLRRPPDRDNGQLYDSVLGESRAWDPSAALDFREYIVYDRRQCYPEYLIRYVRTK